MSTHKEFKKIYLEPDNRVFSEIMSNGKQYYIPRFQRDYAWEENQWDELWSDIEAMRTNRSQHFMGYLVFKVGDRKTFEIIDGQQRLTTIFLVLLAGLSRLQEFINRNEDQEDNQRRIELYKKTYVTVFDTVTLGSAAKLTLNRHNKDHFRDMSEHLGIVKQRNITKTNRKMNHAFQFFEKRFQAYHSGHAIAEIMNDIADGLLFTTVSVQDDLDAYTVFATLNARGLHLSTPDLLKNYLLSMLAHDDQYTDHDFDNFESQWAGILDQLGETEFTGFLRSHTGMYGKLPNKLDLYRALKNTVNQSDKVLPYLKNLKKNAAVYAALQNPDDDFWNDSSGAYHTVKQSLSVLKMFNIRTPLSVLMAGHESLSIADFVKLVARIAVLSIRYNVICRKPAKDQEYAYNKIANKLIDQVINLYEVTQDLLVIYPSDQEFRLAFSEKCMPSRQSSKKIIFLLRQIEHYVSGQAPSETLTLEHVLPFNASDQWQDYFGYDTYASAIDRLGNMALLSKSTNMGQEPFSEKAKVLQASPCRINQHMAEYSEWNMDAVNGHQAWLAKQAATVWRISHE